MTPERLTLKSGFDRLDPKNWDERKHYYLNQTTGKYDVVGLFGSTHDAATWRNEFIKGTVSPTFNPFILDWDPSFAPREAEVLTNASTIIFRLENKTTLNGSLGSLAEIGFAVASAIARGQKVILSIENGFDKTLTDRGARVQWEAFQVYLGKFAAMGTDIVTIHNGDDMSQLVKIADSTLQEQKSAASHQKIQPNAATPQVNKNSWVITGSSGPAVSSKIDLGHTFQRERNKIVDKLSELAAQSGKVLDDLANPDRSEGWNKAYDNSQATWAMLMAEISDKLTASELFIIIDKNAYSLAAITELGWQLVFAMLSGQKINLLLEPLNVDEIFRTAISSAIIRGEISAEERAKIAPIKDQSNIFKSAKIFLSNNPIWQKVDAANRARNLVLAHISALAETHKDVLSYTNNRNEFISSLDRSVAEQDVPDLPNLGSLLGALDAEQENSGIKILTEKKLAEQLKEELGVELSKRIIIKEKDKQVGPNSMLKYQGLLTIWFRASNGVELQLGQTYFSENLYNPDFRYDEPYSYEINFKQLLADIQSQLSPKKEEVVIAEVADALRRLNNVDEQPGVIYNLNLAGVRNYLDKIKMAMGDSFSGVLECNERDSEIGNPMNMERRGKLSIVYKDKPGARAINLLTLSSTNGATLISNGIEWLRNYTSGDEFEYNLDLAALKRAIEAQISIISNPPTRSASDTPVGPKWWD